jgi:hypothetical protein
MELTGGVKATLLAYLAHALVLLRSLLLGIEEPLHRALNLAAELSATVLLVSLRNHQKGLTLRK